VSEQGETAVIGPLDISRVMAALPHRYPMLRLEVEFVQKRASVCKFAGRALIEGKVVAQANFTAMIADPPSAN
jgi:3-hydroxymyristoyl/3-hydroxydecanoyl-(acyl carrier protein) dehydratase